MQASTHANIEYASGHNDQVIRVTYICQRPEDRLQNSEGTDVGKNNRECVCGAILTELRASAQPKGPNVCMHRSAALACLVLGTSVF